MFRPEESRVACGQVLLRRVLAGLAGAAVLLAVSLPGTGATANAAPQATYKQGEAHKQSKRQKSRPKSRRRCRIKQRQRREAGRVRRGERKRPCRRAKRSPRRIRRPAPAPAAPRLPSPVSVPVVPVPPPPTLVPSAGCTSADTVPSAANLAAIRSATLCLVNAERTSRGLVALVNNAQLAGAAQGHADDMAAGGYFSHTSADGRTFDQRIRSSGYGGGTLAENIAWGGGSLGTPRRIVGSWMNSGGHRANILSGTLRDSGIGVASRTPQGGGGGTYVHAFGAP